LEVAMTILSFLFSTWPVVLAVVLALIIIF
jgi:hypothetical protein